MDDDMTSTATMTSVTEDLSGEESDEATGNDFETSSVVSTSDANEGFSTVIHTPVVPTHSGRSKAETVDSDVAEMSVEGDSGKEEGEGATGGTYTDKPLLWGQGAKLSPEMKQNLGTRGKGKEGHSSMHDDPSKQKVPFPNLLDSPGNWYEHSCFSHYWRHYQYVSMWCQKHMEVYKTVVEQHSRILAQQEQAERQRKKRAEESMFKKPASSRTIRNRKARRRRKAAKKRMRMALKNAELAGISSQLSASSEDVCDKEEEEETSESVTEEDEHMEISEEMLDFFAHTHRHRKERDAMKKIKKGQKEEKHVNIEEVKGEQRERSSAAPTERPGTKRTMEMRHLYGKGAAMIHGMETALQMTFDRNLDVHQPSLWPNMPFRVIFD